ncbi:MAG: ATP-binding cassette domain-containing protein [Oscillospiraceae bacterium]|nr:ATP-binding cassette domain-containing protein [Oscillospiraceae bacterium]
MIKLDHISKTFGSEEAGVHAVRDVTLQIAPGEIFGIIGYSGAGKSTLVRCINLLEKPTAGTVTVDGQELTRMPARELRQARKKISMIFQLFNLMPSRTVAENVAFPLKGSGLSKEETKAKVNELLELVDLPDKAEAYPSQLSGGQKQRVAIARALASDPKVLLCDEATSALDPQTTRSILRLIQDINRKTGITVVVITHEMAVVKEICHRVAVMELGRVVELGSVFDIFSNPQQSVTRSFIATTSNLGKIDELIAADDPLVAVKPGAVVARLNYSQSNTGEATISEISRKFNVDVSIVFSNVEIIEGQPLGGLVAIISGDRVTEAIGYLSEKNVMVEVLKRG